MSALLQSAHALTRYSTNRQIIQRSSSLLISLNNNNKSSHQQQQQQQEFSTKKNKELTYTEHKKAKKEKRTMLYKKKEKRLESLPNRRANRPDRGIKRRTFRAFFRPRQGRQLYEDREARRCGLPWKIRVATVLERLPVILPDEEEWEEEWEELRSIFDKYGREYPKGILEGYDNFQKMVEQDLSFEEIEENHLPESFTPLPRETEADATGDVRTHNRKLQTRVFLTILTNNNNNNNNNSSNDEKKSLWTFPEVTAQETETLLDAAKRALVENVGSDVDVWSPTTCPCAVDTRLYDEGIRDDLGFYGEKVFYFRIQRNSGEVEEGKEGVEDHAWLTREEMANRALEVEGEEKSKFYHYLL